MEKDYRLDNMTHGLIVIDPESLNENGPEIVHFCGYWSEPSEKDVISLLEELASDEEFGLSDILYRLEIYPATEEILEFYKNLQK